MASEGHFVPAGRFSQCRQVSGLPGEAEPRVRACGTVRVAPRGVTPYPEPHPDCFSTLQAMTQVRQPMHLLSSKIRVTAASLIFPPTPSHLSEAIESESIPSTPGSPPNDGPLSRTGRLCSHRRSRGEGRCSAFRKPFGPPAMGTLTVPGGTGLLSRALSFTLPRS